MAARPGGLFRPPLVPRSRAAIFSLRVSFASRKQKKGHARLILADISLKQTFTATTNYPSPSKSYASHGRDTTDFDSLEGEMSVISCHITRS